MNEGCAREVNGHFIRVVQEGVGVLYVSGAPKDGAFVPSQVPLPKGDEKNRPRKVRLAGRPQLLIDTQQFTTPDGSKFVVESGVPYQQIEVVLHGLLVTFAVYIPFIISLAIAIAYCLISRSPH